MLVGGGLGFPFLVVLVVLPAIGFVVRRKWRHAVARREEVRRLLVLASEEAARAELEAGEEFYYTGGGTPLAPASASVPFDSSLKPQYQCAVCFCPTTTRCAKCKAVRYCSGRCQIIHWRQGHKDECRPYVAVNPINDVGGSSYKQEDGKDHNESFNTDGQRVASATQVERLSENLHHKNDIAVENLARQQEATSTYESASDSSYEDYSTFSTPRKSSVEASSVSSKSSDRSEHQTLVSPARKSTSSGKINQNKSDCGDECTQSRSSSSSFRTDDGSNESFFSETSTASSGFWGGAIRPNKSSIDELGDFAPSSFREVPNGNMTGYQPSLNFSVDMTKSGQNTANGFTGTASATSGSKKSKDETASSMAVSNDGLKSKRPPTRTAEMLKHSDADTGRDLPKSEYRESKIFQSGAVSHHAFAAGRHSTPKNAKTFGGLPLSMSIDMGASLSKASDTHLASSTGRTPSASSNSVKVNGDKLTVSTCSSQLKEYPQSVRSGLKSSMMKVVDHLKPSKISRDGLLGGGSETAHKYSCKGLFSYETFVKLYNWKKIELQPFGLMNCGNSCYANAVLQCLTYTPPLTAYLLQGLHSKSCDKREWCFTCEFEGLLLIAKDGSSPISPIRILSRIEHIGSNLGRGREEDAHEFLRYAIDSLQSACLKQAGTHVFNPLEEETTLVGLTFGGYLRSKIQCMKCGGKSERHERMMDLTVEIEGNIETLEEALDKFTCMEILDGENLYKCGRCKSYEKAKKKLTLLEAPNVLTIALKRFQSGNFGKLNKSIRFPEILDMAPYVSGRSDKSPIYRLYGVVVHIDVMNAAFSGHYVCYVKNVQNRWFKIDDSMVKEVDLHSVLTKGAYMLLYARCSPRAPRSIRSSLTHHHHHHHEPRKPKPPSPFHPTQPWHTNTTTSPDRLPVRHRTLEDESSSSSDTSGFFSESCSCSTDTNSVEDHIFGDWERDYSNTANFTTSSDSDTSSSSFPSPLYTGGSCKYCRNLVCSCSKCRETNLGETSKRPGVTFRRSAIRGKKSD